MTDPVQGITQRLAIMALDAYELRHKVIANNIANADSANFRPMRLNFEAQLTALKAAARGGASPAELATLSDRVKPTVEFRDSGDKVADSTVRLDDEMIALVQNTAQYGAVITALERGGDLTRIALGDQT